jgi:pimeloyl-ACP methyl ester carboxylesterase
VFLDAANGDTLERRAQDLGLLAKTGACLLPVVARVGALRLFDPWELSPDAQAMALMYRTERWDAFCALARGISQSVQEFRDAPALRADVPLVVLSHENPTEFLPQSLESWAPEIISEWYPLQQRFASRSTRGSWRVVPGSGHLIASDQPEAVARAILEMVAQVRTVR